MQKALVIALLFYFVSGTLLLPQGDFSTLVDLPHMYQHCRDTEDADMDIPDFIVEHLLQIDDDSDEIHAPGDHEKPHQPIQFNHSSAPVTLSIKQFAIRIEQPIVEKKEKTIVTDEVYLSDYPASVFRPPIIG